MAKKLKNSKISDTGKRSRKYIKQKQLHCILVYNFYPILNRTTDRNKSVCRRTVRSQLPLGIVSGRDVGEVGCYTGSYSSLTSMSSLVLSLASHRTPNVFGQDTFGRPPQPDHIFKDLGLQWWQAISLYFGAYSYFYALQPLTAHRRTDR